MNKVLSERTARVVYPDGREADLASELMGIADIAKLAGVQQGTVAAWIERHADFPPYRAHPSGGRIWLKEEVLTFLRDTERTINE